MTNGSAHRPRVEVLSSLNLAIKVVPNGETIRFDIPVFSSTLDIARHPSGSGWEIHVVNINGETLAWFAAEIVEIRFHERTGMLCTTLARPL